MSSNQINYETLIEKLKYLYTIELREKQCIVKAFDIDFVTEDDLIEEVDIYVTFDYEGHIDGIDPYTFANDIKTLLYNVRQCFTSYTPTKEGKFIKGDENVYVSDGMVFKLDYEWDVKQIFLLSFKITYED
jgi:hypothetical protein